MSDTNPAPETAETETVPAPPPALGTQIVFARGGAGLFVDVGTERLYLLPGIPLTVTGEEAEDGEVTQELAARLIADGHCRLTDTPAADQETPAKTAEVIAQAVEEASGASVIEHPETPETKTSENEGSENSAEAAPSAHDEAGH